MNDAIQVRLSTAVAERLDRIALACSLRKSELIRRAVAELLDRIETEGQLVVPVAGIPPDASHRKPRAKGKKVD